MKDDNQILEGIYHRAQEKIWDGRDVLRDLIAKHGTPSLPLDKERALQNIFAVILEGELAAWKISLQLAEKIVTYPLAWLLLVKLMMRLDIFM